MLTIRPVGKLSLSIIRVSQGIRISIPQLWAVEPDGQRHGWKLMLRGESSARFSAEQKNKTSFSLLLQFFSEFSQIGQKNYSLANLALHQLNCELVGVFFVSAIIRLGRHVKSQIRKSSLVRVYCISVGKKGVSWVLYIYSQIFSICSNVVWAKWEFVNL